VDRGPGVEGVGEENRPPVPDRPSTLVSLGLEKILAHANATSFSVKKSTTSSLNSSGI
jgi:hypothetical protein